MNIQYTYFTITLANGDVDPLRFKEYSDYTNDRRVLPALSISAIDLKSEARVRYETLSKALTGIGGVVHNTHTVSATVPGSALILPEDVVLTIGYQSVNTMFDILVKDDYDAYPDTQGRAPYDEAVLLTAFAEYVNVILTTPVLNTRHEVLTDPARVGSQKDVFQLSTSSLPVPAASGGAVVAIINTSSVF